ncbi:hypothetical protein SDC9_118056 [bioreactor metagenome]|uniref:Uncharacterized protein n=1 Tax=bioreactor metagenome TaxID=1076179 RepID=A0A645C6Z8_9ZZZZ
MQAVAVHAHVGNAGHEATGVRVGRLVDHLVHGPDLGHAARIHHRHAVAGFGDDTHVVRDQHDRRAARAADVFEQRDNLRLDGYVQGRCWFVGNDQFRLCGQRQRDHHTLAHATRELVGVVIDALLGRRNAGVLEQRDRALARLRRVERQMRGDGLDQLSAHGIQRVERGERVLKNRADAAPTDMAHLFGGQVVDALAIQQNLAGGDVPRRFQQADDGRAGERFARPRFAHHAQDLAGRNRKRHVVERAQRASAPRKLDHQILNIKQGHGLAPQRRRGLRASRNQSPNRFTDSAITTSITPGNTVIHHSPENR